MKKKGSILCLVLLIVTMAVSVCFGAESLEVVKSYPKDGQKNTTTENMGVKLWFNNDMGAKDTIKANEKCFKIVDDEGKSLPIKVFYSPKDSKEVMVLLDANKKVTIKDNTEYTLQISDELQDSNGNSLAKQTDITFRTLNAKQNTTVYMIMMAVMFVGMFVFSSRQMKKQMAEQREENHEKEEPFNPYKEAKKQGKSVEEVMAQHEKEVAKKEAKEARKHRHDNDYDYDDDEEEETSNGNYRVKGPRPISASGSTYKTGRKAIAEARKAEEERLAKRRAANKKKKKK